VNREGDDMLSPIAVILCVMWLLRMINSCTLPWVPSLATVPRHRGRTDQRPPGPPTDLKGQVASKIQTTEQG
jgi:hypothetical protein